MAKDNARSPPIPLSNSSTLIPSLVQTETSSGTLSETQALAKPNCIRIRPCYILIVLGILSIAGSLAPAIWQASIRDDLSGGFTLAQYILGVGIFIVGSMVAIHSRTCTFWQ